MLGSKFMFLLSCVAQRFGHAVQIKVTASIEPQTFNVDGTPGTPALGSTKFLLISSPSEKKVVWTKLDNFQSALGRAYALVDDGLAAPKGIAFDHNRGFLYVADSGAKAIYRYTLLVDTSVVNGPGLTTSGVRLPIVEGHAVEWVAVDHYGDLFYTAPDSNNINKVSAKVMDRIASGQFHANSLEVVSEKKVLAQLAQENLENAIAAKSNVSHPLPTDRPPVHPKILQIYEGNLNPHVSAPASILTDSGDLYWANKKDGTTAGTVVRGLTRPGNVSAIFDLSQNQSNQNYSAPYPAVSITNISNGAVGIGKTDKAMFFTHVGAAPDSGLVTGLLLDNPTIVFDFVKTIAEPRALVWDKDQTVYVADQKEGNVWSFPVGRMMENVPLTQSVAMKGAYGLVMLSSTDRAFTKNKVHPFQGKVLQPSLLTQARIARGKSLAPQPTSDDELSSFMQLTDASVARASRLET